MNCWTRFAGALLIVAGWGILMPAELSASTKAAPQRVRAKLEKNQVVITVGGPRDENDAIGPLVSKLRCQFSIIKMRGR